MSIIDVIGGEEKEPQYPPPEIIEEPRDKEVAEMIANDPAWYEEIKAVVLDEEKGIIGGPMLLLTTWKIPGKYQMNFDPNGTWNPKKYIGLPTLFKHGIFMSMFGPVKVPQPFWHQIQIGTWTNCYFKPTSRCRTIYGEFTAIEKYRESCIKLVKNSLCGFSTGGYLHEQLRITENQQTGAAYDYDFDECSLCPTPALFGMKIPPPPPSVKYDPKPSSFGQRKRPI